MYLRLWIIIWDSNTILTESTFMCKIWKSEDEQTDSHSYIPRRFAFTHPYIFSAIPFPSSTSSLPAFPSLLMHFLLFPLPTHRLCPSHPSIIGFSCAPLPPTIFGPCHLFSSSPCHPPTAITGPSPPLFPSLYTSFLLYHFFHLQVSPDWIKIKRIFFL